MPRILPSDGPVQWPPDEGVIGVVGVAPWATIDFVRSLYEFVDAGKDWHYPRVLLDIIPRSRACRYFEIDEEDPLSHT